MTFQSMGFWNGTAFRSYIDNNGNVFFGNSTGARIEYNYAANQLRGTNSGSVVQWYANGNNGALMAGAGNAKMGRNGFYAQFSPNAPTWSWPIPQGGLHFFGGVESETNPLAALIMGEPARVYAPGAARIRSLMFRINHNHNYAPASGYYTPPADALLLEYNNVEYPIWHGGNDGAASGLDADLLDGLQASAFAQLSGATFTGTLNTTGGVGGAWTTLTLTSPWGNNGSGWATAQYCRFGDWVMIKGLVTPSSNAAANATILTLPEAIRPAENRRFSGIAASAAANLDVLSSGVVRVSVAVNSGQVASIECTYKQ
jgi:hypothetical protein